MFLDDLKETDESEAEVEEVEEAEEEEEEGEEIEGENKDKNCIFYKRKKLNLSR